MKKNIQKPFVNVIRFRNSDIITTSGGNSSIGKNPTDDNSASGGGWSAPGRRSIFNDDEE